MPPVSVRLDPSGCALTFVVDLPVDPTAAWKLWSDPRLLERWWGPPTYPATVEEHALVAGGRVTYFMTGPKGDVHRGWWTVETADEPALLELVDGFADADGAPMDDLPLSRTRVELVEASDGGCRMTFTGEYRTAAELQTLLDMGMEEGMVAALGQIDGLLPEL